MSWRPVLPLVRGHVVSSEYVVNGTTIAGVAVLTLALFIRDKIALQRYEDMYKDVQGPALPTLLCDLP